eukprot:12856577-Ditylum_brightwellii.AAC.1
MASWWNPGGLIISGWWAGAQSVRKLKSCIASSKIPVWMIVVCSCGTDMRCLSCNMPRCLGKILQPAVLPPALWKWYVCCEL